MKKLTLGRLNVIAAGGTDGHGGGAGPAVLLCHGYGAPGDDLVSLHDAVDAGDDVRWFFPAAPLTLDTGMGIAGRAWWHIDMLALQIAMASGRMRDMANETPDGLHEATTALRECVALLCQDHGVERSRLVVGGFSQGAMITTELALHEDEPFAGLVTLSGALLSQDRWRPAAARQGAKLQVFQSHGRYDPILPYQGAEALRAMLIDAGASVSFVPFAGQHEIPYPVIDALGSFLRARLPR